MAPYLANPVQNSTDAKILSWIVTGIRHEGVRLMKRKKRLQQQECLVLNAPVTEDGTELLNFMCSTCDTAREAESNLFIEEALSLLTRTQQRVILETIIEDIPEHIVASELGTSQQAVHMVKMRALRRLKTNETVLC